MSIEGVEKQRHGAEAVPQNQHEGKGEAASVPPESMPPPESEPGRAESIQQVTKKLAKQSEDKENRSEKKEEKHVDDHGNHGGGHGHHHKPSIWKDLGWGAAGSFGAFTLGGGIALGGATEVVGGYTSAVLGWPETGSALIHGGQSITAAGKYMLYNVGPWIALPALFLAGFFATGFVVDWVKGKITGAKPAKSSGGGGGGHGHDDHGHGGGGHH